MGLIRPSNSDISEFGKSQRADLVEWLRRQPVEKRRSWIDALKLAAGTEILSGGAAAFVAERAKTNSSVTASTFNFSYASVTIGNLLVAGIGHGGTAGFSVTSVTDTSGATWARPVNEATVTAQPGMCIAYAIATAASGTVTVNFTGNQSYACKAEEFSGMNTLDTNDTGGQGASATTGNTGSATPAAAGELGIQAFHVNAAQTTFTPGSGFTNAGSTFGTAPDLSFSYILSCASGLQHGTGTWVTTATWAGGLAFFKFVAPPKAIPLPDRRRRLTSR